MSTPPGGYIPPANPGDAVPAVLSEGEAWVGAAALNRYGTALFVEIGGIPAANVHPVPDLDGHLLVAPTRVDTP